MIEIQKCADREEWDEYVLEHGGHPLQLWGWGQLKTAHGWTAERYFGYEGEKIIGAAQVLIRPLPLPFRRFAYVPRGPVVKGEHAADLLNGIAERVKSEYSPVALSVEPDGVGFEKPEGWQRSVNKVLPAETIVLDLKKSESDLLAVMAKKTRQYIRKSAADGVTIKQVKNLQDLNACLDIYESTSSRAQFNVHSRQYYLDVYQLMGDHSPVFAAYSGGEPIAFLWMAISADVAFELYGGVNEVGQELRANYALKWHVIRKMKEWGLRTYDFGGFVEGGVTIFKQGWAEEETVLAGTFDKPLSPTYVLWSKILPFAKKTVQTIRKKR